MCEAKYAESGSFYEEFDWNLFSQVFEFVDWRSDDLTTLVIIRWCRLVMYIWWGDRGDCCIPCLRGLKNKYINGRFSIFSTGMRTWESITLMTSDASRWQRYLLHLRYLKDVSSMVMLMALEHHAEMFGWWIWTICSYACEYPPMKAQGEAALVWRFSFHACKHLNDDQTVCDKCKNYFRAWRSGWFTAIIHISWPANVRRFCTCTFPPAFLHHYLWTLLWGVPQPLEEQNGLHVDMHKSLSRMHDCRLLSDWRNSWMDGTPAFPRSTKFTICAHHVLRRALS